MTSVKHGSKGKRRWIGLGMLAASLSMIVLDGTIVGVALPTLISDLDLDVSEAQWVNGVYSVVFAALLLTSGRLGDRFGRRRLLIAGIVVFVAGSVIAAFATSASTLIAARVVQGVGGSLILPTTLSSVNATFRGRDRAIAFGVWGAVISGMAALGPLAGGWITTTLTWQWIFIVNVPLGAILIVGVLMTVDESRERSGAHGVDVVGLLLSVAGFGLLVFGLIEGQSLGWWAPASPLTIFGWTWGTDAAVSAVPIALVLGAASLVFFVMWEQRRARRNASAILDLSLFRVSTFRWGNLVALCVAIGEFGLLFVLPLFIVNALGVSTLHAGLALAAMGLGAFVAGAEARHISARFSAPTTVLIGLVLETVAVATLVFVVTASVSLWLLAGVLVVYGLGLGLASAQLTGTVLADIPVEQSGQGSATQSTVRQVGSALGTAVIGTVLAASLAGVIPVHLDAVEGLPSEQAASISDATVSAAGGTIEPLREQGTDSAFGPAAPDVVEALSEGMADATRISIAAAGGFLALGAIGSTGLRASSRRARRVFRAAS
ncbi:DHA2 family efflux MFS transporter permease subunit [Paramicrobacterium agarici]|uniref:DHA2 family efflux MFS transporter permease subunit n=1 Tax=Paramicrobacterium agarici TaxID=630514 RepID=UPI00116990BE|nr:DHA2 family efflux MFS transporter permease subunit [Microbacterium agarici]TQO23293.1 EmrB/QacA subfamily drug resistance transporter [Microbacterium agarici]